MATDPVLYELDDAGVARVTLNDPDTRNALSTELLLAGLQRVLVPRGIQLLKAPAIQRSSTFKTA